MTRVAAKRVSHGSPYGLHTLAHKVASRVQSEAAPPDDDTRAGKLPDNVLAQQVRALREKRMKK